MLDHRQCHLSGSPLSFSRTTPQGSENSLEATVEGNRCRRRSGGDLGQTRPPFKRSHRAPPPPRLIFSRNYRVASMSWKCILAVG
ncbi:hypothetical protein V6N12_062280 [Hibiscus sabdariffa]|uniref:Uncharacterized protein n=1 Tax=Hibiscus sabdariffa TaxID=183260 RepID=A0ABR2F8F4_9ROSI